MTATSTPLGADFPKQVVELLLNAIDEGTKQAARMLWDILTTFLSEHWLAVLLVLFVLFIVVTLKAMMGRWGSLGSFLYNFFYFGILLIIGLIWGSRSLCRRLLQRLLCRHSVPDLLCAFGHDLGQDGSTEVLGCQNRRSHKTLPISFL